MTNNVKLNDLQLILLSTASQRDDGSVLPAADSIAKDEKRIGAAIPQLLKRGLIEEVSIKDRRLAWREEGDQPLRLTITEGRAIIDREEETAQTAPNTKRANRVLWRDIPIIRVAVGVQSLPVVRRTGCRLRCGCAVA